MGSADSEWIFPVLDDVGVTYTTRSSQRGVPYAAFRSILESTELAVTVISVDGTLRLTAHSLGRMPTEQLATVNRRLPLARVYQSPDGVGTELALSFFIDSAQLSGHQVSMLICHLHESQQIVAGQSHSTVSLPDLAPLSVIDVQRVADAVTRRGKNVERSERVVSGEAELGENSMHCRLLADVVEPGWIIVRAHYLPSQTLPSGPLALATLQRLQAWTTAGRYTVDETGTLGAEVATPGLGVHIQGLADWTLAQATLMLQAAARNLQLPSTPAERP